MSSIINVGLIGCGRIARLVHLNILKKSSQLRLVAIADSDTGGRDTAGKVAPEASVYPDFHDLLAAPDIDAVIICLPNSLHAEAALAALDRGKHIYLEKPLAGNTDEGRKVMDAWKNSSLTGMIGFNLRFNPLYRGIKKHIESGGIGKVTYVRTVFSSSSHALPMWKRHRESGGGALLDLASHHIDLVRYILGTEIKDVFARVRSYKTEHDHAVLQLTTADGLEIQSFFSLDSIEKDEIEIYGTNGKLTADRYLSINVEVTESDANNQGRLRQLQRGISSLLRSPNLKDKMLAPGREPSFELALNQFASAVRNNHKCSPDFEDGYMSLSVIEAAEESARSGAVISINDYPKRELTGL
ncbi:MAG: Gfo/Idh/MocA family oxidoreductase [Deltaproteobacteria bacterium]